MIEIVNVTPGSTAAGLGIRAGDAVVSINRNEVRDIIDFSFLTADEDITLAIRTREGRSKTFTLHKEPDDMLGLELAPLNIKRCRNKCIFCFVDQMPAGCRKSLYIKDDDFRASFLYGNYITLGALSEEDWQRIFSQRLSPLYVSVHATDPALRSLMLRNVKAPDILASLKRLAAGGIRVHTQIVLCPGVNDGRHLERTLDDLAALHPAVVSIAVVPVGLTTHRKKAYALRTFTRREARTVIDLVTRFGSACKRRFGTRLAYPSDEFYIKAGLPVPSVAFYEDFPQQENGVGMVADFLRQAARTKIPAIVRPIRVTVVTGVSFSGVLREIITSLRGIKGASVRLITVKNRFFGPSVTVAGLLTGRDFSEGLQGKRLGDMVLIPASTLKEGEDVFLDGMKLEQLETSLGVPVRPVGRFPELIATIRGQQRRMR